MAKPAFIYAFDNLGPERFAELCGELLGARYRDFQLGGVGPDGGVDGELNLHSETPEPAPYGQVSIQPGQVVLFQFKHVVVARSGGQGKARESLKNRYLCDPTSKKKKSCELHRDLVQKKGPDIYVLVTNVEVNSKFRDEFIMQCRTHYPHIKEYQVVGLDELEVWVKQKPELRHLYFPTIFGPPRFDLHIHLTTKWPEALRYDPPPSLELDHILTVSIFNTGIVPSYVNEIRFCGIIDGKATCFNTNDKWDEDGAGILREDLGLKNPDFGTSVEPGRKQIYYFHFSDFNQGKERYMVPTDAYVSDEIGNEYREVFPQEIKHRIQAYFDKRGKYRI